MEFADDPVIHSAQIDHADHMKLMVATAPESFNAQSEPLPRTDWTATASDASPGYPVTNILDGDPGTIWHSRFEGVPAPLPHAVTLDMKAARDISGLRICRARTATRTAASGSSASPPASTAWTTPTRHRPGHGRTPQTRRPSPSSR